MFCHVTRPNKTATVSMVRLSQSLFLKLSKPTLRIKMIKDILIMIVIIGHLSEYAVYDRPEREGQNIQVEIYLK